MAECLVERRLVVRLSYERTRILRMDKCTAHSLNEEIENSLTMARNEIRYGSPDSTTLSNPIDQLLLRSFVGVKMGYI